MNELDTVILGQSIPTFNLLMAVGILVCIFWIKYQRKDLSLSKVVDIVIGGLIGAVLGGRLFHVWLNWHYFADNQQEILMLSRGGLDWHGAVIGTLLGMWLIAKLTDITYLFLLETIAFPLPLFGYLSWRACQVNHCAYGAEVSNLSDYPPLIVAELPDIFGLILPRFNTQLLGMILSLVIMGILMLLRYKNWFSGYQFAITLLIFSSSMFLIGFLRGDRVATVLNLRLDQWLDIVLMLISIGLITGKIIKHFVHSTSGGQT